MHAVVEPGKYVVAVSGGVDSVALLDMLAAQSSLQIVVAHFDHGIRPDSAADAVFVAGLAEHYGVPYFSDRAELGPTASEATARRFRYEFLRRVQSDANARAIITAHHQDDLLETAIMNILRGTGRRGLSSLRSTADIVRPLLDTPKAAITDYALKRGLSWHEDTTNHDESYTRNYIRRRLLVRFEADARQRLFSILSDARRINELLDSELAQLTSGDLRRTWFNMLPHDVSKEMMAAWLRNYGVTDYDRKTIERLTIHAKVKPAGKSLDVRRGINITVMPGHLALSQSER